jgi:hypothetical protein
MAEKPNGAEFMPDSFEGDPTNMIVRSLMSAFQASASGLLAIVAVHYSRFCFGLLLPV